MLGLLFFIHLKKKRARTVCFDNQFNHYIYIFDVNKVDIRKRSECLQSVFDKRFSSQIYIFSRVFHKEIARFEFTTSKKTIAFTD